MTRIWLMRLLRGAVVAALLGAVLGGIETALVLRVSVSELLTALQRLSLWLLNVAVAAALAGFVGAAASALLGSVLGLGPDDRSLASQTGREPMGSWLPSVLGITGFVVLGLQLLPTLLRLGTAPGGLTRALTLAALVPLCALAVAVGSRLLLRRLDLTGRGAALASLGLPTLLLLSMSLAVSAPMRGGRGTGAAAREEHANLLLISVDGLRADHVGAGARVRTPTMHWMGRHGVTFTQVTTASTSEAPPVSALLTGRHPLVTGFLADGQALPVSLPGRPIPLPTLAEKLAAEGYSTGAFVSSAGLDGRATGLSRGFTVYDDGVGAGLRGAHRLALLSLARALQQWGVGPPPSAVLRSATQTVARLGEWMSWHHGERQFAWLHLSEPRNSSLGFTPDPADLLDPIPGAAGRAYGSRVVGLDEVLGDVFEALEVDGVLDQWLVVIVGTRGHVPGSASPSVVEPWTQVPVLLFGANLPANVRIDAQVRLEDLPATALTALGFATRRFGDGVSLLPLLDGRELGPRPALVVSPPRSKDGRCGIALREGRWKYTRDEQGDASLYDLLEDPFEVRDVQEAHPDRMAAAARELDALLGDAQPVAEVGSRDPLREAVLAALRHL